MQASAMVKTALQKSKKSLYLEGERREAGMDIKLTDMSSCAG
jgi:hypothetical protein